MYFLFQRQIVAECKKGESIKTRIETMRFLSEDKKELLCKKGESIKTRIETKMPDMLQGFRLW